jgi:murein DD-endopeptidase MepM/ murein hydrolase activator NlpD
MALAGYILTGRHAPQGAVDLSFPLRNGTYVVVNGGGNELINAHYGTMKGERFLPWRGQSYGVDIEKLNRYGLRAHGILPKQLTAYEIFGEPLYAPCAGEVIVALDGVDEMTPPQMDRQHMAGNHTILRCGSAWVVLGHLQKGSVQVGTGQRVARGHRLGRVGNTGNTGEPHLHIHAQRPGTGKDPLSGEPLPIRFDQRYPVRNTRITAPAAKASDLSTGESR